MKNFRYENFKITNKWKNAFVVLLCLFFFSSGHKAFAEEPISNADIAIDEYKKVIKNNKNDKGAHMSLVYLYYKTNQYPKMYKMLHTVRKHFENGNDFQAVLNNYAIEAYKAKKFSVAEDLIQIALDNSPQDQDSIIIYLSILKQQKKYSSYISVLSKYIDHHPKDILMIHKLLEVYLETRNYQKAYDTALAFHKKNMQEISFYFYEALALQPLNTDLSIKHYKAYLDKLSFAADYPLRVEAAQRILAVLQKKKPSKSDYQDLISYLKKINAPTSHRAVQAYCAYRFYPNESVFLNVLERE